MDHTELGWKTKDGLSIYGQEWMLRESPKAMVCLVHGIGEHSGRYEHLAEALVSRQYGVLAYDLRGHGKSDGKRGYTPSQEALMDDITLLLDKCEYQHPGIPRFLYGHSLGGNLVIVYAMRYKLSISGVVATGPELELAFNPPAGKMALAYIMKALAPGFTMASGLDTSALSHDPEIIEKYVNDPLVHDRITPQLFFSFYTPGKWALKHANEFSLPLLLMHGADDKICSAKASEEFAKGACGDVTLKLWPGMYHEIHNEFQKQEVMDYAISWLDAHIKK